MEALTTITGLRCETHLGTHRLRYKHPSRRRWTWGPQRHKAAQVHHHGLQGPSKRAPARNSNSGLVGPNACVLGCPAGSMIDVRSIKDALSP